VGGRELGVAAGALALGIAVVLGGFHSLAPGHGKTLMAAAVVGRRGTARQVLAIGGTVAATHTTGVLVLGSVLWLTQSLAPDRLLPWLTAASGALLAIAGATLLLRRLTGRGGLTHGHHHHRDHDHAHGDHPHDHHEHGHHEHPHDHAQAAHRHDEHGAPGHEAHSHDHGHPGHAHGHDHRPHDDGRGQGRGHTDQPSGRWLITMGMAGGLVPTPSALVVLLGATALGRAWFGVVLVAAYGIGMALTLLGAGLLLVRFQDWIERHFLDRSWWPVLLRVAPVVTAALLVGSGLMIAARGLATA
jgi:ABC-type nickel/cobalt efflux system permease component RcnA